MSLTPRVTPEAEADLASAMKWYGGLGASAAAAFLRSYERTLEFALEHPEMYQRKFGEVRTRKLHRFRYVVAYIVDGDWLVVIAVPHASRGPEFWQARLRSRA